MAVQQRYESVEEINATFRRQLRDAETDDEKKEISLQQREAVAEFREQEANRLALEAHKATVVAREGLGEFSDFVFGSTPEEIDAAAAKLKERVEKLSAPAQATAAQMYGATGAGGGTPPSPQRSTRDEELRQFEQDYNRGYKADGTLQSKKDFDLYVQRMLGAHVAAGLNENGSKHWRGLDLSKLNEE